MFILISGHAAALVFAKIMLERAPLPAPLGCFGARGNSTAFIVLFVLFVLYAVSVGDAAARLAAPDSSMKSISLACSKIPSGPWLRGSCLGAES